MPNRVARLELADCGLHATSVDLLQKVLLDLEHRGGELAKMPCFIGEGHSVEELVLDGGGLLGGAAWPEATIWGTLVPCRWPRSSGSLPSCACGTPALLVLAAAVKVLRLRNIGISDGGLSQIISTLVSNKSARPRPRSLWRRGLELLDLRGNGLCTLSNSQITVQGVRRFNKKATKTSWIVLSLAFKGAGPLGMSWPLRNSADPEKGGAWQAPKAFIVPGAVRVAQEVRRADSMQCFSDWHVLS